jgi:tetratricopeptide (TPR) repeat protein
MRARASRENGRRRGVEGPAAILVRAFRLGVREPGYTVIVRSRATKRGARVRTVVIDTNVLLSEPGVIGRFHDADVVIPEMVLSEIDKLKTARVDPELRYRGRQVSRVLFELSERGSLQDGVPLPGGGQVRVVGLASDAALPAGLSARNADDRIVGVAVSVRESADGAVTLVTNDLNMLLKAQAHHLEVEHVETDEGLLRRLLVRPFQRYRTALSILGVALAVFAAAIYLTLFSPFAAGQQKAGLTSLPPEFLEQLSVEQQQQLNYLFRLQGDPNNLETLSSLATVYDNLAQQNSAYLPYAVRYWEKVVSLDPNDDDARTDLATDYLRQSKVDQAIGEIRKVLAHNPDHINANLNLGIMYMYTTPKQYQNAANQFARVITLTKNNPDLATVAQRAHTLLTQVENEAKAAGQPVTVDGSTL